MALDYEQVKLRLANDSTFYREYIGIPADQTATKNRVIGQHVPRLFNGFHPEGTVVAAMRKYFDARYTGQQPNTASDRMVTQPLEDALSKWLPENDMSVEISKLLDNGGFVHSWRMHMEGNFEKSRSNMRDYVSGWLSIGTYSSAELDQVVAACIKNIKSEVQPNESKIMTYPNIEVKTFISGIDSKDVSDDAIFNKIATLENEITQLDKTAAKPKKLIAKIEALQGDIAVLVAFVDAR